MIGLELSVIDLLGKGIGKYFKHRNRKEQIQNLREYLLAHYMKISERPKINHKGQEIPDEQIIRAQFDQMLNSVDVYLEVSTNFLEPEERFEIILIVREFQRLLDSFDKQTGKTVSPPMDFYKTQFLDKLRNIKWLDFPLKK